MFLGPRKVVQLGEKLVDFNSDFQLFLTTRNISPDIPPDVFSSITLVNFITSPAGLSGQVCIIIVLQYFYKTFIFCHSVNFNSLHLQLLACALCTERPELEKRRGELLRREEELSVQLHTLQDGLLQQLAQAQGDILQNKVFSTLIFISISVLINCNVIIIFYFNCRTFWLP